MRSRPVALRGSEALRPSELFIEGIIFRIKLRGSTPQTPRYAFMTSHGYNPTSDSPKFSGIEYTFPGETLENLYVSTGMVLYTILMAIRLNRIYISRVAAISNRLTNFIDPRLRRRAAPATTVIHFKCLRAAVNFIRDQTIGKNPRVFRVL